ncbi:MAG TPA: hypothetical protein VGN11_11840, partial [Candidatus Baltobacteraceae bacterium]|nr:hypothetical protein [Candidatus Baltobacteraceae bacterium]
LALIVYFFWAEFRSLRKIEPATELYDYRIMLEGSLIALAAVSLTIDLFTYKYAWLVFSMFALLRHVASTSTDGSSAEPLPEHAGSGIFIAPETALPERPHPAF